jgi:hypothetical protein
MQVVVESNGGSQILVTVRQVAENGQVIRTVNRLIFEGAVNGPSANEIARATEGGRAAAQRFAVSQGGTCRTLVTFGARFGVVAIVMLGYNGYLNAGEAAAKANIAKLETFYGDCDYIFKWINQSYASGPITTDSCSACYDASFGGGTLPPGTGAITVCSSHFPDPQASYNQMVQLVGNRIAARATTCAAKPGGYYSQPFRNPLFLPDPPNVPDKSTVCPY